MSDNELIAEFHGWTHVPTPKGKGKGIWNFTAWNKAAFNSECFLYHKSWDWLMPVVEKISKITFKWETKHESGTDSYYLRTFGMLDEETGRVMVRINNCALHTAPTLIEATYKAVVEFIKWYNENKPDNEQSIA